MPPRIVIGQGPANILTRVYLPKPKDNMLIDYVNDNVDEVLSNIMNEQIVRDKLAQLSFKGGNGEKGLDFSYTFLIWLNKFAKQCVMDNIVKHNISKTLLNLYETLIVYEIGPISDNILSLIVEILKNLPKL